MRSGTGKSIRGLLLAGVLSGFVAVGARTAEITVIANPSVKASSVTSEELKGVFLMTRTSLADGSRVEPVVMKSGSVHGIFVRQFIGKTDAALETYYRSLVFTGKGMIPKTVRSDSEVIHYVTRTKGAIGYVGSPVNVPGVKVLELR